MRKIISKVILILIICFMTLLTGCTSQTKVEQVNTLTIEACMATENIKVSENGKNLTYYYRNANEINLYYTKNWNKGIISLKKFFTSKEHYDLEKKLNPGAKYDDKELTILIKEYMKVPDMESHWKSVEANNIYTIVK